MGKVYVWHRNATIVSTLMAMTRITSKTAYEDNYEYHFRDQRLRL